MPKISYGSRFDNEYIKFTKHNRKRADAIDRILKIFASNPKHPSLRIEKLSGGAIWTIRIDRGHRLFFTWSDEEDTAIFFFVGPHDAYRNVKR